MQTIFLEWLAARDVGLALRLLEQTHDKAAYNVLFDRQLSDLLRRVRDQDQRNQLEAMLGFDWIGDIEKALQRAGFGRETDEMAHDIVVKLLVSPGGLFAGWKGQPMEARFRASVKNAIFSATKKIQTRRRLLPTVSIAPGFDPAVAYLGQLPSLTDEFLDFLRDRFGELHTRVLQHRLAGGQTRELYGKAGSRHAIKEAIKDIKMAAREFAAGDREFQGMVQKAMADEKETVGKRRATMTARKAVK